MRLPRLTPTGQRRLFGFGFLAFSAGVVYWSFFSDGLPIIRGPRASASEIAAGKELFEHEWTPNDPLAKGDGLGPVFNAKSCASCHFQGGLGGAGAVEHNVLNYEVAPRPTDPTFHTGTVHNFSTDSDLKETLRGVRNVFPTVRGRKVEVNTGSCRMIRDVPDFDPVRTESVQATALFGSGWIDLISDRAILRNARNRGLREAAREMQLEFDNIPVGRVRHVAGGVGKFGWKAQFATLEEFVAAACANELGLGTPMSEQAKPLNRPNSSAAPDLDKKQFRSLVSFVKTLPRPVETEPDATAQHGKGLFTSLGCAVCHIPNMGGVKNVYSDFLLYTLDDPTPPGGGGNGGDVYDNTPPPELNLPARPDSDPKPSEWKTPPLWGVADSAPYLHDGSAPTLHAAIIRHRGDAKKVTEKYTKLSSADQAAVVAFLNTLKAPPEASPLSNPAITKLAKK